MLTGTAQPCDADSYDLPRGAPPAAEEARAEDDYFPYASRPEFELADLLFRRVQMAGTKISDLMDVWAAYQQIYEVDATYGPPFSNAQDLYNTIDSTEVGEVRPSQWNSMGRVPVTRGFRWHHGRGSLMRSGFEILLRLWRPRLLTRTTHAKWTMHLSGCLAGRENACIQILCLVIGHGNRL